MKLRKVDLKMLILAWKLAIGSSAAMFLAQAMHLENAGSAGTIALLTIVTTKWETLRLTYARFVTFAVSVLLVLFVFSSVHILWLEFGAYIFLSVLFCEMLGWRNTLSVNCVIGTHFLISQDFSAGFIVNELMLVVLGTTVAFLVNLFSHNKHRKKQLVENIHSVENQLQMILGELASYLRNQRMSRDVWQDIRSLEEQLKNLVVDAYEYEGNTFRTHTGYYMDYFEMRLEQCNVLHDLHYELQKIRSHFAQAAQVAAYMEYLVEYVVETNSPIVQIQHLESMVQDMNTQPLPRSQEEFETRAVLYHILTELEAFLIHKKRFVEGMDEKQRKLYWNETK